MKQALRHYCLARTIIAGMFASVGCFAAAGAIADEAQAQIGTVQFSAAADETRLPRQFRLVAHAFEYRQQALWTSSKTIRISTVTFPSPVVTPHPNNNTVHCEYFCPLGAGKKPGVIVLHIMGGDFDLARLFCRALASDGTAALFLKMPYYGERRQPDSPVRMISLDPQETIRGMTQAVLDIRQAGAWLATREEIDPGQLGVMGISLGGITAALAASMEPRFSKVCLILAGGDIGEVAWTSTELEPLRKAWSAQGKSKESLFAVLKTVDPVTYARPVAGRKVLMLNASHDEVIPRACTEALWRAFDKPEIVWWDAGHYTAMRHIFEGMARTVRFFKTDAIAAAAVQTTAK